MTDVKRVMPALRKMAELGLILQVHGEVTHQTVDIFVAVAMPYTVLKPLLDEVKDLRVVMEHITTKNAADFVSTFPEDGKIGGDDYAATRFVESNALFKEAACDRTCFVCRF